MADTDPLAGPFSDALYDALMTNIEPELTTARVDLLDAEYFHETPERRAERMARYDRAFKTFEESFSVLISAWTQQYQDLKKEVMGRMEKEESAKETSNLSDIERAIDA